MFDGVPNVFRVRLYSNMLYSRTYQHLSLLTLELPHQSNLMDLQFYFKIPTSCYIFSPQ